MKTRARRNRREEMAPTKPLSKPPLTSANAQHVVAVLLVVAGAGYLAVHERTRHPPSSLSEAANPTIQSSDLWRAKIATAHAWLRSSDGAAYLGEMEAAGHLNATFLTTTIAGQAVQLIRAASHHIKSVVTHVPGRGLSVFYAGENELPAGTVAALYPCLMIRHDLLMEWQDAGRLDIETAEFWDSYSIDAMFPAAADSRATHRWYCAPVGELPDAAPWFTMAELDEAEVGRAVQALNSKVLHDWRGDALYRGKWRLPRSAHRFNEPSAGDAPSSIEHISDWPSGGYARGEGGPCSLLRAEARVCGTVLEARTRRALRPGEELAWCYGGGYTRHYRASAECTRRRGGGTRMREQRTRETEELL